MIRTFCKKYDLEFLEASAKDAINVGKAFEKIARKVIANTQPTDIKYDTVKLDMDGEPQKKDECSC